MAIKKELLIFLVIGIAACVTSNECPAKEDIPGCKCSKAHPSILELNCRGGVTGKTIQDYGKLFQENNLSGKRNIKLSLSEFDEKSRIPSKVFEGLDIVRLEFRSSGNISRWADEEGAPAFVGLEDTLKEIEFYDTLNIPRKYDNNQQGKALMSLGHLRKLSEVAFKSNEIYNFDNGWFDNGPSSLEVIEIEDCKTSSIGNRAFASLTNLKEIHITNNEVESASRGMFPNPADHLEQIALWNNKLEALPDDMFTNMPSLIHVYLFGNSLTRIPENVWRPVWSQLTDLDLSYNELNCDGHIRWFLNLRPPRDLLGMCEKPKHMTGVNLEELIKRIQEKK